MKRRILCLLCAAALALSLAACSSRSFFGFENNGYVVLEEEDSHGGMGNDGTYHVTLDCSSNPGKAQELTQESQGWRDLPLSENLRVMLYERSDLAQECGLPEITHGKYRFLDRHSESTDPEDDTDLLSRGSYNFTVALYDADTQLFYYIEFDT